MTGSQARPTTSTSQGDQEYWTEDRVLDMWRATLPVRLSRLRRPEQPDQQDTLQLEIWARPTGFMQR
jgi:hypothetical protein